MKMNQILFSEEDIPQWFYYIYSPDCMELDMKEEGGIRHSDNIDSLPTHIKTKWPPISWLQF